MKNGDRYRRVLRSVSKGLLFFLLVAFVITCCILLFLRALSISMGIEFTEAHIQTAAKLTFGNVVLLSVLFTVLDTLRRQWMVRRPVRRIVTAAEKIMRGDFSVCLQPIKGLYGEENFNEIIRCFNRMAKEFSGIETLRSDFIGNVSHEMKTPLAVIRNYGTLLQKKDLSEEERLEYGAAVSGAADRLSDLVTNILRLNKLENQQIYPAVAPVDLSEQLVDCLLQYENVWESRDIDIETDIEDGVTVQGDAELLSLIWNNLLSNAFKFTRNRVRVSLAADEQYVSVCVEDNGCGMSREVGARIFEKFYQADSSRALQGNGLGLALVKRVVDILEGEISVESTPGKGSAFTVKIRRNSLEI